MYTKWLLMLKLKVNVERVREADTFLIQKVACHSLPIWRPDIRSWQTKMKNVMNLLKMIHFCLKI